MNPAEPLRRVVTSGKKPNFETLNSLSKKLDEIDSRCTQMRNIATENLEIQ